MKVLLVTNDEESQRMLELALSLRGHEVRSVGDAAAAWESFLRERYPVVIINHFGDDDARLSLCRRIRESADGRNSIIWVTVDPDRPSTALAALDAGASNYLSRPYDAAQLRARLDSLDGDERSFNVLPRGEISEVQAYELYRDLVEHALDIHALLHTDGSIRYVTQAVTTTLGYQPKSIIGLDCFALSHPDDVDDMVRQFMHVLNEPRGIATRDVRLRHADGSWRQMEVRFHNLSDVPGISGIVMVARDITERKAIEDSLEQRALYDFLTALANRALFMDHLEQALARADRHSQSVAVFYMDLDNFKAVNDTFGHVFGDRVLTETARRLRSAVRSSDTVGRLSGDEFGALIEDISSRQDALAVAKRILHAFESPMTLEGQSVNVTISIGIAFSSPGHFKPTDLIHNADRALYEAKAQGKGRFVIFDAEVDMRERRGLKERPVLAGANSRPAVAQASQSPNAVDRSIVGPMVQRSTATEQRAGRPVQLTERITLLEREIERLAAIMGRTNERRDT